MYSDHTNLFDVQHHSTMAKNDLRLQLGYTRYVGVVASLTLSAFDGWRTSYERWSRTPLTVDRTDKLE